MDVATRHNVKVDGPATGRPMLFAHGFGCDQNMWRYVAPRFADEYRVVCFDHVGAGGSDSANYDKVRHSSLDGYAQDVLELCRELELNDVIFVGHSVSAMIGVLAAAREPGLFSALVLVGPSPRYMNDGDYVGGFDAADIDDLLASLAGNYLGWSAAMAPVIMGNPEKPELGQELTESFCRTDPEIAHRFARVTFLSDNRSDLRRVRTPTLVLQCRNDVIAPVSVGEYVRDHMPNASMVLLDATGHCPNLSAPDETTEAIQRFLKTLGPTLR
jgi:sigma-B regulation protein RsbQ